MKIFESINPINSNNIETKLIAQNVQNALVVFDLIGWNSWSLIDYVTWIKPDTINTRIITTLDISS